MVYKVPSSTWDADKFYKFLVIKQNISQRVARDYLSRCRRIETILGIDLVRETSTTEAYAELIEKLACYAEMHCKTSAEVMIFGGTLRLAAKKFALYSHGNKVKFPRVYRRINLCR